MPAHAPIPPSTFKPSLPPVSSALPAAAASLSAPSPRPSPAACASSSALESLPSDAFHRILSHLAAHPAALTALSRASPALHALMLPFRSGRLALPLAAAAAPPRAGGVPAALAARRVPGPRVHANADAVEICKTDTPAHGVYVVDVPLGEWSVCWRVRLDVMRGRGVEVGVTEEKDGMFLDGERSVYFDCCGRVCLGKRRRVNYGRGFGEGEVLGVVYDGKSKSLMFLDGGDAMGDPVRLRMLPGVARGARVYAFVKFGNVPGECVTVWGGEVTDVETVRKRAAEWARKRRERWKRVGSGAAGGGVGEVVVVTWDERVWWRVRCDTRVMTLRELRREIARKLKHGGGEGGEGMGEGIGGFELIHNGGRLVGMDHSLEQLGVSVDPCSGTTKHDILLSIPHLVS